MSKYGPSLFVVEMYLALQEKAQDLVGNLEKKKLYLLDSNFDLSNYNFFNRVYKDLSSYRRLIDQLEEVYDFPDEVNAGKVKETIDDFLARDG
ncbi:hypothetical protein J4418_01955 [Candidatus Woesearchaeota archaeon]|nr:hypothetical protein [Candidatus Woesearchaeota archaeon]